MVNRHQTLNLSLRRKAFVCGDIHGEYPMLEQKLNQLGFDPQQDVLISVGDLADRGPQSERALEYIKYSWFKRVLGNHDIAPRLYLKGNFNKNQIDSNFGGGWFTSKTRPEIEGIARRLEDAPVALTVVTPNGNKVGIVHAECYPDWNVFTDSFWRTDVYDLALWSRDLINTHIADQEAGLPLDVTRSTVSNINHVFCGHTPLMGGPFTCGNISWIDQGAVFGGDLTVWDIDDFLNHKREAERKR